MSLSLPPSTHPLSLPQFFLSCRLRRPSSMYVLGCVSRRLQSELQISGTLQLRVIWFRGQLSPGPLSSFGSGFLDNANLQIGVQMRLIDTLSVSSPPLPPILRAILMLSWLSVRRPRSRHDARRVRRCTVRRTFAGLPSPNGGRINGLARRRAADAPDGMGGGGWKLGIHDHDDKHGGG